MTTVIIDFKERKVLADKQTTQTFYKEVSPIRYMLSDNIPINEESFAIQSNDKIHRIGDVVLAGAGNRSEILRLVEHYEYKGYIPPPKEEDVTIAVVRRKGEGLFVELYDAQKGKHFWNSPKWDLQLIQGTDNFITFGSGGNYAYGAIKAGVPSEDAIRAASKCDKYTSFEYDSVTL
ncbi:peptidase HslV family [Alteromonas phage vB_AmeM_PT11-V22]|uniref:Proteasome-like protein n=1 Tax=Alteromonas phage vB_AmeM_PT11-V22 TaxID=2704031 RepID=A0A6C0R1F8_9CAUD|nr:peptidase HslV family [Alteromonas phage vB_AmeM_PT11-V22]QHZ59843.1 proteasome-like protein [Alteromonas phage vB_AmeM_PT11-V22]